MDFILNVAFLLLLIVLLGCGIMFGMKGKLLKCFIITIIILGFFIEY